MKVFFEYVIFYLFAPVYIVLVVIVAILARFFVKANADDPKLVWGSTPILNNSYWSNAMKRSGYRSETFTNGFYEVINKRGDWDRVSTDEFTWLPIQNAKCFVIFLRSLFDYDVFFISFDGYFIGNTPLWRIQAPIFKLANKKVVVIPYGADSYVYKRIRSLELLNGLLMSYPDGAKNQKKIANKVDYWCKHADLVLSGIMGPDGFGRWDVLSHSSLCIDVDMWRPSKKHSSKSSVIKIAHAPNHRGFKGTEFIIQVVEKLIKEGVNIELKLIEKMQNDAVRDYLCNEADILIEQLVCTGHGLNAIEGLAAGIPVISNLENTLYTQQFRRWSFLDESPIVSADPESLEKVLKRLVCDVDLRKSLGEAGVKYVRKYHSYEASQYLFGRVVGRLYGKGESLINLYHPLLGDYPKLRDKIDHPLVKNKIID